MQTQDSSRLLRISLLSNSLFSALSGLCFIAAAGPLSSFIGLELPAILIGTGIALVIFAVGMTLNALRPNMNLTEAWIAVILDLTWVIGSAVVIFAGVLSTTGNWTVAIIADIVLLFAILQFRGLRKMSRANTAT